MSDNFELRILKLNWLKGYDDNGTDLCLHGTIFLKIGDEIVSNPEEELTLSAAALFLLRSLRENWNPETAENLLFPHCGHSMFPQKNSRVIVIGCDFGIDLTIHHEVNQQVRLTTLNGTSILIAEADFQKIVLDFAQQIEKFYEKSPRKLPEDKEDLAGYEDFWQEFRQHMAVFKP